jgi:hypothetical protein
VASSRSEYELVVRGRLGPRLLTALAGFEVIEVAAERTRLRGWVSDQAALHGVLRTIADLGIELVSVRRVEADGPPLIPPPHS